jgi:hypothetical protein
MQEPSDAVDADLSKQLNKAINTPMGEQQALTCPQGVCNNNNNNNSSSSSSIKHALALQHRDSMWGP